VQRPRQRATILPSEPREMTVIIALRRLRSATRARVDLDRHAAGAA
jgi:hypothetical protein